MAREKKEREWRRLCFFSLLPCIDSSCRLFYALLYIVQRGGDGRKRERRMQGGEEEEEEEEGEMETG